MNPRFPVILVSLLTILTTILSGTPVVISASPKEGMIHSASPSGSGAVFSALVENTNPWSLALHPDKNQVYYSDPTSGRIAYFDYINSTEVLDLIHRPGSVFHGIALDGPNNNLYFLDSANDSVNVINLESLDEIEIFSGAPMVRPNAIAYSDKLQRIIVTDSGADAIHVIDPKAASPLVASYATEDTEGAWGLAISPTDWTVYFSTYGTGRIYRIAPYTGTIELLVTGLDAPRGLKFDRKGDLYCFEDGSGQISRIDLETGKKDPPSFGTAISGRDFIIFDDLDKDNDRLDDAWELRYAKSLFTLSADSDPDQDSRSALYELIFRGSPLSANDPPPAISFAEDNSGLIKLQFEAPTTGYAVNVWLSSDLQNGWQLYTQGLNPFTIPGTIYSEWRATLDLPQLGLDPDQLFIRLSGDAL